MSGGQSETIQDTGSSIYEKFKENTHKIMIGENSANSYENKSIVDGIEKGQQSLKPESSSKSKHSRSEKKSFEYLNYSQMNRNSFNAYDENDNEGSNGKHQLDSFHNSMKKKSKLTIAPMKHNSPLKLDKNLKSIENRILQKMKNKREGNVVLSKMPSIERNHSQSNSYGRSIGIKPSQDQSNQTMVNIL